MKKGYYQLGLLFVSTIFSITQINAQTLDTITGNGNTTNKSVFINGNAKYNVGNLSGQSLYYLNGTSVIESGNPSTGILAPLNLKSSVLSIPSRTLINNPVDDGTSLLQVNGNIKLGSTTNSGDITISGRQGATLVNRLAEFGNSNIAAVNAGDLHIANYWGIAININKGTAGDNSLANAAVIPGTSSFTINSYLTTTTLNTLFTVRNNGNVGIGTINPQSKLAVAGTITAKRLVVTQSGWADFVFHPEYQLAPLQEVENYIRTNRHLAGIPTTEEVQKEGIDVGEMNKLLLQKVEELTLYMIEEHNRNEQMERKMKILQDQVKSLEKVISNEPNNN